MAPFVVDIPHLLWIYEVTDAGSLVAECDALGLTVDGASWAALMDQIHGVTADLFDDLQADGTLERFVRALGYEGPLPAASPEAWDVPCSILRTASITCPRLP